MLNLIEILKWMYSKTVARISEVYFSPKIGCHKCIEDRTDPGEKKGHLKSLTLVDSFLV